MRASTLTFGRHHFVAGGGPEFRRLTPLDPRLLCSALILAVSTASCSDNGFGAGVRRPPTEFVDRPNRGPLAITEIVPGPGSEAFVEIENRSSQAVDLEGFVLATPSGEVAVDRISLEAGERTVLVALRGRNDEGGFGEPDPDVLARLLTPNAGEAALVNAEGLIQSYVAWGTDPGTLNSMLYSDAFAAGLDLPTPPQLPVPFPLGDVAFVFEEPRGCAAPSPGTSSGNVETCMAGSRALILSEYRPESAIGAPAWIEVQNVSVQPLALEGLRLCLPTRCAPVSEATGTVAPEGTAIIFQASALEDVASLSARDVGGEDSNAAFCPPVDAQDSPSGGLSRPVCAVVDLAFPGDQAEIALARAGDLFIDTSESLIDYARFGADAPRVLQAEAVEGDFWSDDETPVTLETATSYQRIDRDLYSPLAWNVASPTPGISFASPSSMP